ncbi:MAG: dockerin type I repeat-containing protein [Oscillospiraceae bacterium]|nr:dockerin type I repeat-containing protein [Oscillospiraceae bacterium]
MKKKILSVFLAVLMLVLMLPVQAMAVEYPEGDTNKNGTVEVTFTISDGTDNFYLAKNQENLFNRVLNVPYFDIALYGLEEYYYNPDCYTGGSQGAGTKETAEGVVTTMHVFIYATEMFMLDVPAEDLGKGKHNEELFEYISWTQGAGSSFMKFWNGSTNLNYYLDYQFPLGREGWGSTSDQQALHDGSNVSVHLIVDEFVMGSQYAFFENAEGVRDFGEISEGDAMTLTLYTTAGSGYGGATTFAILPETAVYFINKNDYAGQPITEWTKLGTTAADGTIKVPSDLAAGTYYFSSMGEVVGSNERGPAAYILKVKRAAGNYTFGDVNGDGKINSSDAVLVLQSTAGTLGEAEFIEGAADVNGDGKVNSSDAVLILQLTAGTITEFPV